MDRSFWSAKDSCIHLLFEEQAARNPDNIAVCHGAQSLTYQALNQRSNKLAHALLKKGVQRHEAVVIYLEEPMEQITAIFAVLKAGAVFVCLDTAYPMKRLKQIIDQVRPKHILSNLNAFNVSDICSVAEDFIDATTIIDYGTGFFEDAIDSNPNLPQNPKDPLYIVYTSGSTGIPKGILQCHGSSCQYMEWQSKRFDIKPGKRVGQWASIAYDASYSEIFGALCFGATLYVNDAALRGNASAIAEWILDNKINTIQLIPSFCRLVLESFKHFALRQQNQLKQNLEYMMLAGERLPIELAREWLDFFQDKPKLYNLYGPSEIVLATEHLITESSLQKKSIPIGHPFLGRNILILDENKKLCGIGCPGEIYIQSPYVHLATSTKRQKQTESICKIPCMTIIPIRYIKQVIEVDGSIFMN